MSTSRAANANGSSPANASDANEPAGRQDDDRRFPRRDPDLLKIWLTGSVTEGDMSTLLQAIQTLSLPLRRLTRKDPDLTTIVLGNQGLSDSDILSLLQAMQNNPNNVMHLYLHGNKLTDESGVNLAKFLATNSSLTEVSLSENLITDATSDALAQALETNTTLRRLLLDCNNISQERCDAAFVKALRANPVRPHNTVWELYSTGVNEYQRLRALAESTQQGAPH